MRRKRLFGDRPERWLALCVLVAGALEGCGPAPTEAEARLADACAYLWRMQADDGGWHSATHGLLRGGQAWTPFVLHALLEAPADACPRPPGATDAALNFIRRHLTDDGALGLADPDVLEYPNYATAYALRVLARHGTAADAPRIAQMVDYLRGQQYAEGRGFGPEDAAYGSWGFGERGLPPGRAGHVDLSHTRRVLEALRRAAPADLAPFERARVFLHLVQKHPSDGRLDGLDSLAYDGGFFASPVTPAVNKSAPVAFEALPLFESYATTTADGLLALRAAGLPSDDARVQAALRWLRTHDALDAPQGTAPDHPAQWHRVLFFYHLAARAEAYTAYDVPGDWREAMVRLLAERQHPDGHFANPHGALNKEDDPLLATALAVIVLSAAAR